MRTQARSTACPLCGTQLGLTVDDQWVPFALDEYREHSLTRLAPNPLAMTAPDTCVACGGAGMTREPQPAEPSSANPVHNRDTGVEPAPRFASDPEIKLAEQLRHRLEERYLAPSAADARLCQIDGRAGQDRSRRCSSTA